MSLSVGHTADGIETDASRRFRIFVRFRLKRFRSQTWRVGVGAYREFHQLRPRRQREHRRRRHLPGLPPRRVQRDEHVRGASQSVSRARELAKCRRFCARAATRDDARCARSGLATGGFALTSPSSRKRLAVAAGSTRSTSSAFDAGYSTYTGTSRDTTVPSASEEEADEARPADESVQSPARASSSSSREHPQQLLRRCALGHHRAPPETLGQDPPRGERALALVGVRQNDQRAPSVRRLGRQVRARARHRRAPARLASHAAGSCFVLRVIPSPRVRRRLRAQPRPHRLEVIEIGHRRVSAARVMSTSRTRCRARGFEASSVSRERDYGLRTLLRFPGRRLIGKAQQSCSSASLRR